MPVLAPSNPLALSATDFIKSALRLVGALRSGLNLTAGELTDCQMVLNSMLDAFSIERTQIPAVSIISTNAAQVPLSLVAGKQSYKLGSAVGAEAWVLRCYRERTKRAACQVSMVWAGRRWS